MQFAKLVEGRYREASSRQTQEAAAADLPQAFVQQELDGNLRHIAQHGGQQPMVQPCYALLPHNACRPLHASHRAELKLRY